MFGNVAQRVEVDGQSLPIASLLRRGTAIAVDLCLAVGLASLAMLAVSTSVPLDTPAAKTPILVIVGVVVAYLGIVRNLWRSPGRDIFRLRLARLPGQVPGLLGRSVTVHRDPEPVEDTRQTTIAVLVIVLATVLGGIALALSLTSTVVFQVVRDHAQRTSPLHDVHHATPELAPIPRALIVGKQRAYVQVSTRWGEHAGTLAFYLRRDRGGWTVVAVRDSDTSMFGNYSLSTTDAEIPAPP